VSVVPTPEAGGKVDRTRLTQAGRALDHLGVEDIAAYSPQARGRSERVFHTLQDRPRVKPGDGAGRDRHYRGRQPAAQAARLARSLRAAYISRLAMGCCRKERLRSNP